MINYIYTYMYIYFVTQIVETKQDKLRLKKERALPKYLSDSKC